MRETKPEIYKIFKKSLDEPIFNCNYNKYSLSIKIDTAVKKSARYLLRMLKEGNMQELQKEYTLLKADIRYISAWSIAKDQIETIFIAVCTTGLSSIVNAIYIVIPILFGIIKDILIKVIEKPNLAGELNLEKKLNVIYILLVVGAIIAIIKVIIETLNIKPKIEIENYNKKNI